MGQQLIIRETVEEDETMMRCIYNACMGKEPWAADYRLYTEKAMHSFFEEKREKGYPVLVASMGGRLVGFISAKEFGNHIDFSKADPGKSRVGFNC